MAIDFKVFLIILFCLGSFADIFLLPSGSDISLFLLLGLFVCLIKFGKVKSTTTVKIIGIYLGLLFFMFIFFRNSNVFIERISTWFFLLLTIVVIQQALEIIKNET